VTIRDEAAHVLVEGLGIGFKIGVWLRCSMLTPRRPATIATVNSAAMAPGID
jgi:hypothetical protein